MDFNGIVEEVMRKVKRPDKLDMIRTQVNAAVLWFSSEHDYEGDLVELMRAVDSPALSSSEFIIPLTALPRFRSIEYIRIAGSKHYAERLNTKTLDKCTDIRDKWYRAGANINVKLSREATGLDIGYYAFPPVLTSASPDYWMLDGNWIAITEYAASVVFNDIGDPQSSQKAMNLALAAGQVFKGSYIRSS